MEGNPYNEITGTEGNGSVKEIADALKKVNSNSEELDSNNIVEDNLDSVSNSTFKVAKTNLPEKTGVWTKIKNALFYEIKVELTPKQQKVEDEINEFLHQEVTWKKFHNFLFKEVAITYKGKRVF